MNKPFKPLILVLAIMCICTGCASESKSGANSGKGNINIGNIDNSSIEAMLNTTPNRISCKISEALEVDANVFVLKTERADVLFAQYKKADENKLINMFFKGQKPNKTDDGGLELGDAYVSIFEGYYACGLPSRSYYKAVTENYTMKYDYVNMMPPMETIYKKESLDFITREQAIQQGKSILNDLSFDADDTKENVEIYALDKETMEKVQEQVIQNEINMAKAFGQTDEESIYKTKAFTKDDEIYIMCFGAKQNNIPITQKSYSPLAYNGERDINGSLGELWLSKDGVIRLDVNANYEVTGVAENVNQLITVADALEKADEINNMVITSGTSKITEIRFEYVPVPYSNTYGEVKLVPAWSFDIKDTINGDNGQKLEGKRFMLINAVNGELIQ